uniref:F-box associated beta-propeller type 3 domain-containing protein n=1 Tax=Aegilops tauschii TaxID=37682 RepID=N1QVS8_AEGTA
MRISLPWDVDVDGLQSQVYPFAVGRRRLSEADGCCSGSILEIPMAQRRQGPLLPQAPRSEPCRTLGRGRVLAPVRCTVRAQPEHEDVRLQLILGQPMCSIAKPHSGGLVNICNGLLCFVLEDRKGQAPAVVCNPVTGETLALPAAPPLSNKNHVYLFVFGFSPPTNEYKLFRFSFPPYSYSSKERVDVDVYTLGNARGWRKDSFLSPSRPPNRRNSISAPVMIDGKLHVVTKGWNAPMGEEAAGVLVMDVHAETCRIYPLPNDLVTYRYDNPLAFELKGRLCLAAHMFSGGRPKAIRFWVMSMENKESDSEKELHWDLRYNFFVEVEHPFNTQRPRSRVPWSAWFQYETLYYTRNDTLHRYDTRSSIPDHGPLLQWNKQLQTATISYKWRWMVHRGYRPTLLSPRVFELPPSQDETMMDICS